MTANRGIALFCTCVLTWAVVAFPLHLLTGHKTEGEESACLHQSMPLPSSHPGAGTQGRYEAPCAICSYFIDGTNNAEPFAFLIHAIVWSPPHEAHLVLATVIHADPGWRAIAPRAPPRSFPIA